MLVPVALLVEGAPPALSATNLGGLLWLTTMGTAVAYYCWFRGLVRMPAGAVAIVGLVNPVVGTLLGVLFAGELFGWAQALGMVLVLGGVVAGQRLAVRPRRHTVRGLRDHRSDDVARTGGVPGRLGSGPWTPTTTAAGGRRGCTAPERRPTRGSPWPTSARSSPGSAPHWPCWREASPSTPSTSMALVACRRPRARPGGARTARRDRRVGPLGRHRARHADPPTVAVHRRAGVVRPGADGGGRGARGAGAVSARPVSTAPDNDSHDQLERTCSRGDVRPCRSSRRACWSPTWPGGGSVPSAWPSP